MSNNLVNPFGRAKNSTKRAETTANSGSILNLDIISDPAHQYQKPGVRKVTTVFDKTHKGYNELNSVTHCPVCNVKMREAVVRTVDNREIPVSYCMNHATCLPTGLEEDLAKS